VKEENKTKVEPIKDLKTLQKKGEKSAVNNITKRKQAEEELKDSEEYLKILFDYAPDAYYINDLKGNFIDGNKVAERLTGYKREELIGSSFLKLKLLSLADIPKATKVLVKNLRGQPTGSDEFVLNRKDNDKVTVEISTYPVKIKGKTLVLGIARDITERKEAEEALLKALAQANEGKRTLDALMEQVPEGITIADAPDVRIRMVSRYGRELTGKSKEILEGITVDKHTEQWDIYCADGETPAKNEDLPLTRATQEGELVKDEEWVLGNQFKGRIPILCNAGPIRDEVGNITGGVIAWRDITERKQAEERIKHLNLVLRAIRNVNKLIIKVKDRESLLKGACENLVKTRGYHNTWIALLDKEGKLETFAETGLGKVCLPMIELFKKGRPPTCSQKALKQQEVVIIEDPVSICAECPLAQKYFGRGAMTTRLEYNRKVYGLMSVSIPAHFAIDQEEQDLFKEVAEDIAFGIHNIELDEERKQAEEALRASEERYFNLFNNANDLIQVVNPTGKMLAVNKKWLATLEYSPEDVKGLRVIDIIREDKIPQISGRMQEIAGGGTVSFETVFISKSGKEINVEGRGNGIFKDGKLVSAMGIFRDITERKQAEEETRKKTEDLALINTLNSAVNRGDSLTELLQLLARETKRIFSCYGATAYLLSEDKEHLVIQILTLPPVMISRVEKLIGIKIPAISIPLKAGSLYRKTLQEGKPQLINDPKTIQGLMAEFTESKILKKLVPKIYPMLNTRSLINVPLISEGEVIGLLDISRKEPFTEFDLKRFETISGQLTSIIERKQADEALRESEKRLRIAGKVSYDLIYEWDVESNTLEWFGDIDGLLGYRKGKISRDINAWLDLIHPEDRIKLENAVELHRTVTKPIRYEYKIRNKDNTYRYWKDYGLPLLDNKGRPYKWIGVCADITERKQSEEKLKNTLDATIETMSKIIEIKDPYTAGHQQRVSQLTTTIAKELNFSPDKIEGIRIASLIHDIGKISVPTEILSKTTTLSDIEFCLIKGHSQAGSDILKAIDFSYPVAQIVLQHHERLNGSGYPTELKGDKILLEARILGVADVVEAMSSHRPYRPSLGIDAALEEISKNKGILYDPKIVDICIKLFKEKGFKFE